MVSVTVGIEATQKQTRKCVLLSSALFWGSRSAVRRALQPGCLFMRRCSMA
jgi:hypothetical protein